MDDIPQTIDSRVRFEGRIFTVRTDEVRFADGHVHHLDIVKHGGSYAIIATTADDRLVLVRQYRHPASAYLWEIPAGTAESQESHVDGALRELREETGYRAALVRPLGSMLMTPGFCTERLHFFHASGLTQGEQELDEDERITVASFTLNEAQRMVDAGQIDDAKTIFALVWMRGSRGEFRSAISR